MKELPYITHDFGARNDPKLMDLQMEMGGQGLGIFWCLVEMLWENGGAIPANYKSIAFALRWCKPSEVEKVVTSYGLFEVQGGYISSRSASSRINEMRTYFGAKSASGRKGAEKRWNGAANSTANGKTIAPPMAGQCDANGLTNILTNKQTNKHDNNNITPLTAADFYEIFMFRNLKNPSGEAQRFVEYYAGRDWTYLDGSPVTDPEQAARDWKPEKPGRQFNEEALRWYHAAWNCARTRVTDARHIFIDQLEALFMKGKTITLRYKSRDAASAARDFILNNDLGGDYQLDFRVAN